MRSAQGQRSVDVIELNRGDARDRSTRTWRDVTGSPYSLPRVSTSRSATAASRSPRATTHVRPDPHRLHQHVQLQLRAARTRSTENNLYTPRGGRGVPRPPEARRRAERRPARSTRRRAGAARTVLALEALRRDGVEDPERNVVVILGTGLVGELFGRRCARIEPWTEAQFAQDPRLGRRARDSARLRPRRAVPARLASSRRAEAAGVLPELPPGRLPADRRQAVLLQHDPAPRRRRATARARSRVPDPLLVLLVTLGILLPLSRARVRAAAAARAAASAARRSRRSVFFAAIGLGFLLLEVVLIQRFVCSSASRPTRCRWCCSRCSSSPGSAPAGRPRRRPAAGADRRARVAVRADRAARSAPAAAGAR